METVASQKCRSGIFACEVQEEMETFFTTAIHRDLMRETTAQSSIINCM